MERSWFKYGNFDTRDYPNLLIELLPNRNIAEKSTDQVSVFGQNGVIAYPGGLKNTTRVYNIALISNEDDRINRFGTLARFIDLKLRSQDINSELTDSYLVFPDDKIPKATKWATSTKYSDIVTNKKTYYLASYVNAETITNLYNVAARVTVTFNTNPLYYSFEARSYLSSATNSLLYIYFNDDHSIRPGHDAIGYPFLFLLGDGESVVEQKYWQPADIFWFSGSKLKLHAKSMRDDNTFNIRVYYQPVYYDNYPSGEHATNGDVITIESRKENGNWQRYSQDDEITIDMQSGIITDKFGNSRLAYAQGKINDFPLPWSLTMFDNNRQPYVRYFMVSGSDNASMYNGRMVFGSTHWTFSLEVIKHE